MKAERAERALGDSLGRHSVPSFTVAPTCKTSHDDDNHRSFSAHKSSTTYDTDKNRIIDNELRQPITNLHEHLNGIWLNWPLPVCNITGFNVDIFSLFVTESHTSDVILMLVIIIITEMFSVNITRSNLLKSCSVIIHKL